jgi:hypothetical protein
MTLKDFVSITDEKTVRGFVVFKKGDVIIFEKENMIVSEGRRFIRELFINHGIGITDYSSEFTGYQLKSLAFGSSGQANTQSTDSLRSEIPNRRIAMSSTVYEASPGQTFIKFRGVLNLASAGEGVIIRELGLFLTATATPLIPSVTDKLFSRVVFDPIPVEPGESYEVEYYIYF